jgi:hypothetical protein
MENNKRDILILFLIFLGIPFLGYLFYTGNHGNLYGYYLTGYYLIIVLFVGLISSFLWKYKLGKLLVVVLLFYFLKSNIPLTIQRLNFDILGNGGIAFQSQLLAVNWIKNDADGNKFNVDVYVPPVIPHSYNYLFLWNNIIQEEKQVKLLYTLYEQDSQHPERLKAWLDRQDKIGKVVYQEMFGGIIVQRRERI